MPKIDLTRTRRIRVPLGGGGSGISAEVRQMKSASFYWIRPQSPEDEPETGYINQGSEE